MHIPALRVPLYSLHAHLKQWGCGFVGDNSLGGMFVYFPSFILSVDTSRDCHLQFCSLGATALLKDVKYGQPRMEMSAARAPESPGEEFGGLRYPPGRRPSTQRRRLPPRTCCLAVALTTLGTCLFVAGCVASFGANGGSAAVELFVLAALTLLPGVYASYHLVGIKLRWPGFDNVAMFHEDVQFV